MPGDTGIPGPDLAGRGDQKTGGEIMNYSSLDSGS